jgi:shikimate dehydrogenase
VVSRSGSANYNNLHAYSDSEVIINTTPVGMYPSNGKSPIDLSAFPHCEAVCDLIYNPMKTALLLQAEKLGLLHTNGMSMLAAQAKYSSELFTGASLEHSLIEIAIDRANGIIRSIVLIGMPGCGKSSVGVALANRLGKVFLDTDDIVKINTDKTPAQLIRSEGENIFRDAESEAAIQAGKATGAVIATGGGIVLKESNMDALRQNALVVFIDRDLHRLATSDRPLSTGKNTLKKLWEQRLPLYKKYADIVIDGNASITEVAEKTLSALKTYT